MDHRTHPGYDLVVVGGNPAGLSLAWAAQRAGLERVAVLARGERVVGADLVGRHRLEIHYQAEVRRVGAIGDGRVVVETDHLSFATGVVAIADRGEVERAAPPFEIPAVLLDRVHEKVGDWATGDHDVLVVGEGEAAAEAAIALAELGAGVVLALPESGVGNVSRWAREELQWLEAKRRLTVLWRSMPDGIEEVGGHPMVYFPDRRTPDLQFDHVVVLYHPTTAGDPIDGMVVEPEAGDRVVFLVESADALPAPVASFGMTVPIGAEWNPVRGRFFPGLGEVTAVTEWVGGDEIAGLRDTYYNATITEFDPHHSDLWVLRVRPDHGDASHLPGQYATLGLGYWEPRIDNVREDLPDKKRHSLIRRSYSISSPIFDENGYLASRSESEVLEFYIVLVRPTDGRIPSFTPRLALKAPGERIYLGAKVAGRYTLEHTTNPFATLVFLGTGTGEAPHNAMVTELLRKGHVGPIVNAVTVRYVRDLAYNKKHEELARRFDNYHYLALPTREPGRPKRYIQDTITDGTIETLIGAPLDPTNTEVFLCGNPAMIGLPEWEDDLAIFPTSGGVVELLMDRGFVPDRRGYPGNVHYEEYW